jgi:CheY-like chemotaxis protein
MTGPATPGCVNNKAMQRAVLIVEDAEICASTLEILFSSIEGLKVVSAPDAEKAWEFLESQAEEIGAVVTDLHMPGMDGFELMDRVRADARHAGLPIIVITGCTDPEVTQSAVDHGANAVFIKPYSPAAVREKLERLLNDDTQLL